MLLTGRSEGTTTIGKHFLATRGPSVHRKYTSFSRTACATQLLSTLRDNIECRHQTTYGAARGRKHLYLLIDDLSLPFRAGAASPVSEVARQLMEQGGMLRGNRSIKVEGLVVFGVAAARCGGIAALEPRFASHFYELEVQPFSNASMISIFRGSLDACLSAGAKVEPQDLLACSPALA